METTTTLVDYEISCRFLKQQDILGDLFKCMDLGSLVRFSSCSKEIHTFFLQCYKSEIEKWSEILKANQKFISFQEPKLQKSMTMMSLLCSRWKMIGDKVWIFHACINSQDFFYLFNLKKGKKKKSTNLEFQGKGYFPAQNGFSILKPSMSVQASETNPLCFIGCIDWKGSGFSFIELYVKFVNNSEFVLDGDFWQVSYRPTEERNGSIRGEVYGPPFKSDQHHHHHHHHRHPHTHTHDDAHDAHDSHDTHTHSKEHEDHTHSDFHNFPSYDELQKWKRKSEASTEFKVKSLVANTTTTPARRSCLIQ